MMNHHCLFLFVTCALSLATTAMAFRPVSSVGGRSLVVLQSSSTTKDRAPVDWNRAKHCAEHFGACEVEEVEQLHAGKGYL